MKPLASRFFGSTHRTGPLGARIATPVIVALIGLTACGADSASTKRSPGVEATTSTTAAPTTTTAPTATTTTQAPTTTTAKPVTTTTLPPATTTTQAPTTTTTEAPAASGPVFANCTAAKAAGYHDIHRGEPGYSTKLDRDGDGVACES